VAKPVVVAAHGARDHSGVVLPIEGTTTQPPVAPAPDPTLLTLATDNERGSASSDATPAWKLALLALLAAAEAFLVVRLLRHRRPGMLHPVQ
jgi:hypothetical protein